MKIGSPFLSSLFFLSLSQSGKGSDLWDHSGPLPCAQIGATDPPLCTSPDWLPESSRMVLDKAFATYPPQLAQTPPLSLAEYALLSPEERQITPNPGVVLFTTYTKTSPERLAMSRESVRYLQEYADRYGYTLLVDERNLAAPAPAVWSKIRAALNLFEQNHSTATLFVWLDDDLPPQGRIEDLLLQDGYDPEKWVYATEDSMTRIVPPPGRKRSSGLELNSGFLAFVNTPDALPLIQETWEKQEEFATDCLIHYELHPPSDAQPLRLRLNNCDLTCCSHEQEALSVQKTSAQWGKRFQIIPQRTGGRGFNTYLRYPFVENSKLVDLSFDPPDTLCDPRHDSCHCLSLPIQRKRDCVEQLIHYNRWRLHPRPLLPLPPISSREILVLQAEDAAMPASIAEIRREMFRLYCERQKVFCTTLGMRQSWDAMGHIAHNLNSPKQPRKSEREWIVFLGPRTFITDPNLNFTSLIPTLGEDQDADLIATRLPPQQTPLLFGVDPQLIMIRVSNWSDRFFKRLFEFRHHVSRSHFPSPYESVGLESGLEEFLFQNPSFHEHVRIIPPRSDTRAGILTELNIDGTSLGNGRDWIDGDFMGRLETLPHLYSWKEIDRLSKSTMRKWVLSFKNRLAI